MNDNKNCINYGIGSVVLSYQPKDWDKEKFLEVGGFTLVFLNYNKKEQIKRAVESVLNQDYPILEMIFMDDASTDGSGDEMEALVRASITGFRHKVLVVRNSINQYITGQWNIAARLASGKWLGMFCADDCARLDRVSKTASYIFKYPTLLGICTSAENWDSITGKSLGMTNLRASYFAKGTDPLEILNKGFCTMGATAFWNRSLFERPLPRVPMDDTFLHYRCYLIGRACSNFVWAYVTDIVSVDYTVGTGVTSAAIKRTGETLFSKWIFAMQKKKYFMGKLVSPTMRVLQQESKELGLPIEYQNYFRMKSACTSWDGAGTIIRFIKLPYVVYTIFALRFSRKFLGSTIFWLLKSFLRELLGLHFAALICVYLIHCKRSN